MAKNSLDPLVLIKSENEKVFQQGLALLEEKGNLSHLPGLVECYLLESPGIKRTALYSFLASITKKGIREAWMGLLNQNNDVEYKRQIMNIMWNSRLDFSPYLVDFVVWSKEGDYQNTLECLTLIEHMEGPFSEEQLLEAQCIAQAHVSSMNSESEQKQTLLSELLKVLEQLPSSEDLFLD